MSFVGDARGMLDTLSAGAIGFPLSRIDETAVGAVSEASPFDADVSQSK